MPKTAAPFHQADAAPAPSAWCLSTSLLLSGGAFFLAGDTRRFLAWMLPLSGGWLVLLRLGDAPSLPGWSLAALALIWLAGWITMLTQSTRVRPRLHLLRLLVLLLAGGVLTYAGYRQARDWVGFFTVDTTSMEPTLLAKITDAEGRWLHPPDIVLVDQFSYRHRAPRRGEIVVFASRDLPGGAEPGLVLAKRVVGLPGERVRLAPPHILINGEPLREPEIFARLASDRDGYTPLSFPTLPHPGFRPPVLAGPEDEVVLGPGEYFVLHDFSPTAFGDRPKIDSRHFGPVPGRVFFGRVVSIVHPEDRRRWLD